MALHEPQVEIRWRAYELRPEPNPMLDPQGEYLTRVWRDSVYPMAEKMGMIMRLPPIQPRSRLAHEAGKWALQAGSFDSYNAAVFKAFFEEGENIGEIDVLVTLARTLGLEGGFLQEALEQGTYTSQVLVDEEEAKELDVWAVPAFVVNKGRMASGVQSFEGLRELVREGTISPLHGV